MSKSASAVIGVFAAVVLLAVGGVAIATGQGTTAPSDQGIAVRPAGSYHGTTAPAGDLPENQAASGSMPASAVRAQMGVLGRTPRASDRVPPAVANSPILSDGAAQLSSARQVQAGAHPRWIATASNGQAICIVGSGELACPPASEVSQRGVSVAEFWHADTPVEVTGVALDSVDSVTIVRGDGSTVAVPVTNNSFSYEDSGAPVAVRWTGPSGPQSQLLVTIPGR